MTRLVFLPGLACDERLWAEQLPQAPEALRPAVSDAHTRVERIEDMAAAVLRETPGPLVLCGASMGGMVALEAARQAPARIAGLALLGTTAAPDSADTRTLRAAAIDLFAQGRAREVVEANVALAFHPRQAGNAALTQRYLRMVLDAGAEQLIRQNRAVMARRDARPTLPTLHCPVLLLCGEADALTPPECTREIAARLPQAELHWIADCGHMLTMEQPAEVSRLLGAWLRQFVPAAPAPGR